MGKPWLEGFKFATYLAVPIALTVTFAFNPDNLNGIIRNRAYVVYPPEGPKPPQSKRALDAYLTRRAAERRRER